MASNTSKSKKKLSEAGQSEFLTHSDYLHISGSHYQTFTVFSISIVHSAVHESHREKKIECKTPLRNCLHFHLFLSQEASLIIKMCLQSYKVLATEPPSNSFTAISAFGMKRSESSWIILRIHQITDNIILKLIKYTSTKSAYIM